jgi:hypothetical protein
MEYSKIFKCYENSHEKKYENFLQNLVIFCASCDQIGKYVRIPVQDGYAVSLTSENLPLLKVEKVTSQIP